MREVVRCVGVVVSWVSIRRDVWFRRDRRVAVCFDEAGLLVERRWVIQ